MFRITPVVAAAVLCLLYAAPAGAGTEADDWVLAHGHDACQWMDEHPDLFGALSTMRSMQDDGVAVQDIPGALGSVISTFCPNHVDLWYKARSYLTRGGGVGVVGVD